MISSEHRKETVFFDKNDRERSDKLKGARYNDVVVTCKI
ncbi:hypothetical protein J2S08_000435 [Bacillus chungangensis]|uniref:Uncharacterized protein n=1 Tax=Bacillus chungangensis TaxID=587633 RepID=A0ABT9WNQ8_9BACI|nr:hypothetical protein [Bacillus chungangensis]